MESFWLVTTDSGIGSNVLSPMEPWSYVRGTALVWPWLQASPGSIDRRRVLRVVSEVGIMETLSAVFVGAAPNCPVNPDARASVVPCMSQSARAGYCGR